MYLKSWMTFYQLTSRQGQHGRKGIVSQVKAEKQKNAGHIQGVSQGQVWLEDEDVRGNSERSGCKGALEGPKHLEVYFGDA